MLIPWQNGIGPFYDSFFGDLGKSPTEVVFNSVRHPTKTWNLARQHDRKTWYFNMLAPWAFAPLLDLRVLLVAGGAIFINIVSSFPYTRDYRFHYSAVVVAGCALATVEAVAWVSKRSKDRVATQASMISVVLACALISSYMLGCAQYSRKYHKGIWPLQYDPRVALQAEAVRSVPSQASVSTMFNIDTHMTHRPAVYEWPVPWCNINWGVHGEHLDDPAKVEYLVLDRKSINDPNNAKETARENALLSDLLSYEFVKVSENDGIVVAKRVHPPAHPAGQNPPEGECFARSSLNSSQPDLKAP